MVPGDQLISCPCIKFSKHCHESKNCMSKLARNKVGRCWRQWSAQFAEKKPAGETTNLVIARKKAETSKCLSCLVFVHSRVPQLLSPYCHFSVLPDGPSVQKPQALFSCGPSKLLQLRETTHERTEIASFSQPLTCVPCNHFYISVTELKHFLSAFYLWASKCTNQPIQENSQEARLASVLQRGVMGIYKPF